MRRAAFGLGLLALTGTAGAQLQGSGDLFSQPLGGGLFQDAITIHNTGGTTIGTLWFAWIPGVDFLPSVPAAITSPAGWTAIVNHLPSPDGYSIEWYALSPGSYLAPGGILSNFGFTSADSATVLQGLAPNSPRYHVTDSFFYIGPPEYDPGYSFTVHVTSVPAPSAAGLLGAAGVLAMRRRR
jgi:MYXO-CTERM domain-containing protein